MKIKLPKPRKPAPSLKKRAAEFAANVKPGRTYYVIDTLTGGDDNGTRVISEIRFTKKALIGLMCGSYSPEQFFTLYDGHVYDDPGHPALYGLQTTIEMAEEAAKGWAGMTNSSRFRDWQKKTVAGTAFRPAD
jgi:hypothetical protein